MEELVKTFHIETKMIIAQLVNFAIVFAVLYRFAYNPILRLLNERTEKIEKGLRDAEASQKKLSEISEKEASVLVEARKQAQEIIKKSEATALVNAQSIVIAANEQSEKMLEVAKSQIEQEKEKILMEVKSEVANLVVMATEKIIYEKLDGEKDRELISQSIK